MNVQLFPKQSLAFNTEATEVLFGGAAGGAKSHFLRVSAIRWAMAVPGIQVYFFRRTFRDLVKNHLRGPGNFHELLGEHIKSGHVRWQSQGMEFRFWNGSNVILCHCNNESDVENYRGPDVHVLIIDELTLFTEYMYRFLRGRVRAIGLDIPPEYRGRLPRIEAGSNPGGVGHAFVKRTFVSQAEALKVWRAPPEEGGMLRQFIPAKWTDNLRLVKDDPEYPNRLRGLGTDALVEAMLDGNWDIVAGQALEKLRRDVHGVQPFDIPAHWTRFESVDWGSAKPFSVGWWAVSDGTRGKIPKGAIVRYREWYGWGGKADVGVRLESDEVAHGILERRGDEQIAYTVCDPAMFNRNDGPSVAENFGNARLPGHPERLIFCTPGDNNRLAGYEQVRTRIKGDADGPMLYAFLSCHDGFWRTLPDLVIDKKNFVDVDTTQEDHAYDESRYACMSRPWSPGVVRKEKRRDRWDQDWPEESVNNWQVA